MQIGTDSTLTFSFIDIPEHAKLKAIILFPLDLLENKINSSFKKDLVLIYILSNEANDSLDFTTLENNRQS